MKVYKYVNINRRKQSLRASHIVMSVQSLLGLFVPIFLLGKLALKSFRNLQTL